MSRSEFPRREHPGHDAKSTNSTLVSFRGTRNLGATRAYVPQRRDPSFVGMTLGCGAVRIVVTLIAAAILTALFPATPAAAHPLGNFSVNQYSRIEIDRGEARIDYVLDLAELPTVADRSLLDANLDGTIDDAEQARYLDLKL